MSRVVTEKMARARIRETHGQKVKFAGEYTSWKQRHRFLCQCGNEFEALPDNVHRGPGCPKCAQAAKGRKISEIKRSAQWKQDKHRAFIVRREKELGIKWLSTNELPMHLKAQCLFRCRTCKTEWETSWRNFHQCGAGCPKCAEKERIRKSVEARGPFVPLLTTEECKQRIAYLSNGRTDLISAWRGWQKPRQYQCRLCGHKWKIKNASIDHGILCEYCTKVTRHSGMAVQWLEEEAKRRRIKIQHATNGGEIRIPGTRYRVDGYNARKKIVFEFYGDAFHGNPKRYSPNRRSHPFNETMAKTLYKRTMEREQEIRELGYEVVTMWESDYRALKQGLN